MDYYLISIRTNICCHVARQDVKRGKPWFPFYEMSREVSPDSMMVASGADRQKVADFVYGFLLGRECFGSGQDWWLHIIEAFNASHFFIL